MKGVIISLTPSRRFAIKAPMWHVNLCRGIPARRFMSQRREWQAPVTRLNSRYLLSVFAGAHWTPEARSAADASAEPPKLEAAPFPVWYRYRMDPFKHQISALDKMWPTPNGALFMEMGTGKTKTAIDLACARAMDGQIDSALIVAPLSVILSWRDAIMQQSTVDSTIVRLSSKGKHKEWPAPATVTLANGFTWYLVNIESFSAGGMKKIALQAMMGRSFIMVVDESVYIKHPDRLRTKACLEIGAYARSRLIMSGLPMLKGPADLYSQFQFLSPGILGVGDFFCFRNRYVVLGGFENKEIVGYQNLEELAALVAPHTYQVKKKECLDLPDKIYRQIRVELTAEQRAALKSLKSGMVGTRSLKNVLERVLRSQQIASGGSLHVRKVVNKRGEEEEVVDVMPLAKNPKIDALADIIETFDGQFIVWCRFKWELHAITDLMRSMKVSFVTFSGDSGPEERQMMIDDFQAGKIRAFCATSSAGNIGITLTAATLAVYFTNDWSLGVRKQSEDRNHRIGQTRAVEYVDLIAEGSADELVVAALTSKLDLVDYVSKMIKEGKPLPGLDWTPAYPEKSDEF